MSKKLFTENEIKILKKNKYVKNVTDKGITYTNDFRKEYIKCIEKGDSKDEVFKKLGFDIKILGEKRISSFHERMKRKIKNNDSVEDTRTINSGRKKIDKNTKNMSKSELIKYLRKENLELKKENELLIKELENLKR